MSPAGPPVCRVETGKMVGLGWTLRWWKLGGSIRAAGICPWRALSWRSWSCTLRERADLVLLVQHLPLTSQWGRTRPGLDPANWWISSVNMNKSTFRASPWYWILQKEKIKKEKGRKTKQPNTPKLKEIACTNANLDKIFLSYVGCMGRPGCTSSRCTLTLWLHYHAVFIQSWCACWCSLFLPYQDIWVYI